MKKTQKFIFFLIILSSFFWSCNQKKIDYNTQVKPIFNKNCISCHGGVKKQGGYSLLFEEEAFGKGKSGKTGIVPGNAEASELYQRIITEDSDDRMPHEKAPLTNEEISTIKDWINQGAKWDLHWAYKPVAKVSVPEENNDWIKNDIDRFILKNASEKGLKVSGQAISEDLARRSALDIIGFPTDNVFKQEFLKNSRDQNYEKYIDELLKSNTYGEKWAGMWLDLARYADTKGYERDGGRNIWRYRDWLIKAFNKDMPYDQFLTQQLAGDLLPNAGEDQFIATAFHRNTMTNDEGGTDNEEFRTAAVIDRVNTTWQTLMSTSFSCVQCHSHPYDPISHSEYYKFFAFFNNTRDEDTYDDYPLWRHYNDAQKTDIQHLGKWLKTKVSESQKNEIIGFIKTLQPAHNSLKCDKFINAELNDTKWLAMRNNAIARLKNVNLTGKKSLIMQLGVFVGGGDWRVNIDNPKGKTIASISSEELKTTPGWAIKEIKISPVNGIHDLYFTYKNSGLKDPNQTGIQFDWFYFNDGFPATTDSKTYKNKYFQLIKAKVETTPVMVENIPDLRRKTNVFVKGNWLYPAEEVNPGTPKYIGKWPKNAPNNRLGLAMWMTSKDHPLVARTMVNRVWEQLFGFGLVETMEDMGSQGATPFNQPLLDYLSYKFMYDYNWSVKKLIKEIVMSATYRQDSRATKEQLEKDPQNKYLARGARVRLSAEQIRDQALAVCGVLNREMYGPPLMPFQPEGIWNSPWNGDYWKRSEGNQQYRRAIYTFWKRTSPYPSMITFDAMGREVCTSRRIRTNTPLQALVTLNDSVYVDLAAKLSEKALKISSGKIIESIPVSYQLATGRVINAQNLSVLKSFYAKALSDFRRKKPADFPHGSKTPESAALILVNNVILNLDEVITKS
ncbi:MAG: DUF1553 domain-containing protein [Bacteroidetes bacterium]|nr:DUF1553 domain-containing protein [Bacteroidota bacterium]